MNSLQDLHAGLLRLRNDWISRPAADVELLIGTLSTSATGRWPSGSPTLLGTPRNTVSMKSGRKRACEVIVDHHRCGRRAARRAGHRALLVSELAADAPVARGRSGWRRRLPIAGTCFVDMSAPASLRQVRAQVRVRAARCSSALLVRGSGRSSSSAGADIRQHVADTRTAPPARASCYLAPRSCSPRRSTWPQRVSVFDDLVLATAVADPAGPCWWRSPRSMSFVIERSAVDELKPASSLVRSTSVRGWPTYWRSRLMRRYEYVFMSSRSGSRKLRCSASFHPNSRMWNRKPRRRRRRDR